MTRRDLVDWAEIDEHGVIRLENPGRFLHARRTQWAGTRVQIRICEPVSTGQRSYYYAVILPAAAVAMGQDRRSTHEDLKTYIKEHGVLDYDTGEVIEMPGDSFESLSRWSFKHVLTELKLLVRDFLGGSIE